MINVALQQDRQRSCYPIVCKAGGPHLPKRLATAILQAPAKKKKRQTKKSASVRKPRNPTGTRTGSASHGVFCRHVMCRVTLAREIELLWITYRSCASSALICSSLSSRL